MTLFNERSGKADWISVSGSRVEISATYLVVSSGRRRGSATLLELLLRRP